MNVPSFKHKKTEDRPQGKSPGKIGRKETALILRLRAAGYTVEQIADITVRYPADISNLLVEFAPLFEYFKVQESYKGNTRIDLLNATELMLVKSMVKFISETPASELNLSHLANAFHRVHDARRLAEGQATKIVEQVRHTASEILDVINVSPSTRSGQELAKMPDNLTYRASSLPQDLDSIIRDAESVAANALLSKANRPPTVTETADTITTDAATAGQGNDTTGPGRGGVEPGVPDGE